MKYLSRHIEGRVLRMAERFPVVLVGGARQAGKSTLVAHLFGNHCRTFVFDPVIDVGEAQRDPELFLSLNPPPLILDEVQYAPHLLPVIKRIADARADDRGLFFLTGSQQFQLIENISESLAGRVFVADLMPMSSAELAGTLRPGAIEALFHKDPPDNAREILSLLRNASMQVASSGLLLERIFRGGYPRLIDFRTNEVAEWLGSYLRTYVERDVRRLRDLADPHDFTRFLRLAAALTSREINYSQLGREIGINPRTAKGWLEVLTASYQVFLVDAYNGNTVKRVSGRPKIYVTDTGFACHLLSITSPEALNAHPLIGQLFETFTVGEIVKHIAGLDARPRTQHWRTRGGAEVDLILERDGVLYPIEIKLKARPSRRDLSGIRAFAETYSGERIGPRIVFHGGTELFLIDEYTVAIPVSMI